MANEHSTDPSNTPETVAVCDGETGHNVRRALAVSFLATIVAFFAIPLCHSLR